MPLLIDEETCYYVQIGMSQLELIMKVVMEDHIDIMTKSVLMSPRKGTDMMSQWSRGASFIKEQTQGRSALSIHEEQKKEKPKVKKDR